MERYINAEHFDERVRLAVGLEGVNMTDDFKDGIQATLMLLKTEPTADVVEVVRCEDCRYWENRFDVMVCNLTDGMKGAGDYCSYGERRE